MLIQWWVLQVERAPTFGLWDRDPFLGELLQDHWEDHGKSKVVGSFPGTFKKVCPGYFHGPGSLIYPPAIIEVDMNF